MVAKQFYLLGFHDASNARLVDVGDGKDLKSVRGKVASEFHIIEPDGKATF